MGGETTQPTLLIIHGTGLRTRMGVAGLTVADYQALKAQYGARILAFEHPAISSRLHHNARQLQEALSQFGPQRLHVLGLSRGGLVARLLVEGWIQSAPHLQIEKLLFVGTPNEGAVSARRDPIHPKRMRSWRQDVRRLALVQDEPGRSAQTHPSPYDLESPMPNAPLQAWPFLVGTKDQLPHSHWLRRLNGFEGQAPYPGKQKACRYYAVASIFNFDHGAPNPRLLQQERREDICRHVFDRVANDLVVPTAGVYKPAQGPHACGHFPLERERLRVFMPPCNITHVGMLRHHAVRAQILSWLREE